MLNNQRLFIVCIVMMMSYKVRVNSISNQKAMLEVINQKTYLKNNLRQIRVPYQAKDAQYRQWPVL